jgi:hypothetical protein
MQIGEGEDQAQSSIQSREYRPRWVVVLSDIAGNGRSGREGHRRDLRAAYRKHLGIVPVWTSSLSQVLPALTLTPYSNCINGGTYDSQKHILGRFVCVRVLDITPKDRVSNNRPPRSYEESATAFYSSACDLHASLNGADAFGQ